MCNFVKYVITSHFNTLILMTYFKKLHRYISTIAEVNNNKTQPQGVVSNLVSGHVMAAITYSPYIFAKCFFQPQETETTRATRSECKYRRTLKGGTIGNT